MDNERKQLLKDEIVYMINKRSQGMMTSGVPVELFYHGTDEEITKENIDTMLDELKEEYRIIERNGCLSAYSKPSGESS